MVLNHKSFLVLAMLCVSGCTGAPIDLYVDKSMPECKIDGVLESVSFFEETFDKPILNVIMVSKKHRAFNGLYAPANSITVTAGVIRAADDGHERSHWIPGRAISSRITLQTLRGCQEHALETHVVAHEIMHSFGFGHLKGKSFQQYVMYGNTAYLGMLLTDKQFNKINRLVNDR